MEIDRQADVVPWIWLGQIPYGRALKIQRWLREEVIAGRRSGALLLLEHPPTLTLGRHGREAHITASSDTLARLGVSVHQVERGGDVTYHGPGQLVGYPVLPVRVGVRRFVEALGDCARRVLVDLGIDSAWDEERPGLWTTQGKVAAVGLHVARGVAMHGIALNVSPDLSHFDWIVPCGLRGAAVASVESIRGVAPSVEEVAGAFAAAYWPWSGPETGPGLIRRHRLDREAFLAEADAGVAAEAGEGTEAGEGAEPGAVEDASVDIQPVPA